MKLTRLVTIAMIGFTLVGYGAHGAKAQGSKTPDEMSAIFDDINDIDKLRVLNPLKLTAEQVGKLVTLVQDEQKAYNKRLADAAVAPLKPLAKDVKEIRSKLLSGGTIPTDFDEKVKNIQTDFLAKRKKEDAGTVSTLSAGMKQILTKEQVDVAVGLTRNLTKKDGQDTLKGDNDAFFNLYVIGTFITYPRIVPLLQDMQKALAEVKTGYHGTPIKEARR